MTVVPFPNPPGGTLTCAPGQLGVAIIDPATGEIAAQCHGTPSNVSGDPESNSYRNWVLSVVTGRDRPADAKISRGEAEILSRGFSIRENTFANTQLRVYFALPSESP